MVIYRGFDVLESLMREVFTKNGVPEGDAGICAEILIESDKRGIESHGVGRFKPIYIDRIRDGILNPVTKIDIVREGPTTAVLDGNDGMGHVIGKKAMETAIEKAGKLGMGMVAVRNSSHYGIAGYYATMAAKRGMIGITGTNARPSIAPTNGVEAMLGTNPLTFGIPTDEEFDFILDCATSVTQRGKIEVYDREGKDVPSGWVIGRDGNGVTDINGMLSGLDKGELALTPLGGLGELTAGYKGYGYATVVEMLSAALAGGMFMKALNGKDEMGNKRPYGLGHFFIAIDVGAFIDIADFKKATGDILRGLRASERMPGCERIFTAGEKEYLYYTENRDRGVPLNDAMQGILRGLIVEYGLKGYEI